MEANASRPCLSPSRPKRCVVVEVVEVDLSPGVSRGNNPSLCGSMEGATSSPNIECGRELPVELGIESESLWKQFIKEEKLHPKTKEEMEDVRMTMIRGREDL